MSTELFPQTKEETKDENGSKDDLKVLDTEILDTSTQQDDLSKNLSSFECDSNASKNDSKNESPVKNSSFDKECLFSPVTPANKSSKSNIIFSTPNTSLNSDLSYSHRRDLSELSSLHPTINQSNANISKNTIHQVGFQNVQQNYSRFGQNQQGFGNQNHFPRHPSQQGYHQNVRTNQSRHYSGSELTFTNSSFRSDHDNNTHHSRQDYQKSSKPMSNRTNICIGDFIVGNKSATSDKSTGKKKRHSKFVNLSMDDANIMTGRINTDHSSINIKDTISFPEIGAKQPSSKRRINPTRLNTTYPKLNTSLNSSNQSVVKFGVKYDKAERNEAFDANVFQPKEHASSFNMERHLLKKEKEKLLQKFNSLTSETATTSFNDTSKPAVQIMTRKTTLEVVKKDSVKINFVTPDFKSVQNVSALDCISILYSTMLDCNLIVNFTSEIYFLMSLIVAQQIDTKKRSAINHFGKLLIKDEKNQKDNMTLSDLPVLNESAESCENFNDNICNVGDINSIIDSCALEQSISALKVTEDGKITLDLSKLTENSLGRIKIDSNIIDSESNALLKSNKSVTMIDNKENHRKLSISDTDVVEKEENLNKTSISEKNLVVDEQIQSKSPTGDKNETNTTQKSINVIDDQEKLGIASEIDLTDLFSSVHNCIYFAVCTLKRQMLVLDIILDQPALRLLQENPRVRSFCPVLAEHFAEVYTVKSTAKQDLDVQSGILNKNVCFNTDTDSMENFPSQQSFYAFKKQRDLFYDIFR